MVYARHRRRCAESGLRYHAYMTPAAGVAKVHKLSKAEALRLFDKAARRELGMSGEDFLRALDAGELEKDAERPNVAALLMLLPLVRP